MPRSGSNLPNVPCVILAGGKSTRFGSNKAFAKLADERLIDKVINTLQKQTHGPIAVNCVAAEEFEMLNRTLLPDAIEGGVGPLAGILAAMIWAAEIGSDTVITSAVDTPLLPSDFVDRLASVGAPVVACSNGRKHAVHGMWQVRQRQQLAQIIENGVRAAHAWVDACHAAKCSFANELGHDPFHNVNTRDDLKLIGETQLDPPR